MPGKPAGSVTIEVAVGREGAVSRETHLSAMGMSSQHEVDAISRHGIQNPQVWRVSDSDCQRRIQIDRTGDSAVLVAANVRIIHATQIHAQ